MLDGYYLQMTTEELRELYRLAEIGQATELALAEGSIFIIPNDNGKVSTAIEDADELIKKYKNNSWLCKYSMI